MRFRITSILKRSETAGHGNKYVHDCKKVATEWNTEKDECEIPDVDVNEIRRKYGRKPLNALLKKVRLGDKIEAVTRAVGIKPCAGCKKRKTLLNGETI